MERKTAGIEKMLRALNAAGHPACFLVVLMGSLWGVSIGLCPPFVAIIAVALIGPITGFRLALMVFSRIITYNPEVILRTVGRWREDGRWGQLIANIASKRQGD